MAMCPNEARVMDLYDAGTRPLEIARKTGMSLGYVKIVLQRYRINFDADRRANEGIIQGSRDLAIAVNAAGGHR